MPPALSPSDATKRQLFQVLDNYLESQGVEIAEQLPLPADNYDFARECCYTWDTAPPVPGQPVHEILRPFPDYDFLKVVMGYLASEPYLRIDKSGQVLVSWCVLLDALHSVLSKRGQRIPYYCQTASKAEEHLYSRMFRTYLSIPSKFKKPHAEFKDGQFLVYHDGPDKLPTSAIIPQATEQRIIDAAAEKMRSETWTRAVVDESAFPQNLGEIVNSLLPRCGGLVLPSTPNGLGYFKTLGFGDIHDDRARCVEFSDVGAKELCRGVWTWKRNGFTHLRVHYSAHPDRDPATEQGRAWVIAGKSRMTRQTWEREQEISYEVHAGQPVYSDGHLIDTATQYYNPKLILLRGWDFSWHCNACTFAQLDQSGEGEALRVDLRCLYESYTVEKRLDWLAQEVNRLTAELFPDAEVLDFGDISARGHGADGTTAEAVLAARGITLLTYFLPRDPKAPDLYGIELIQFLIAQGWLHVDREGAPFLLSALQGGYVRHEKTGAPVKGNTFDDIADSLRYVAANILDLNNDMGVSLEPVNVKPEWVGQLRRTKGEHRPTASELQLPPEVLYENEWRGGGRRSVE